MFKDLRQSHVQMGVELDVLYLGETYSIRVAVGQYMVVLISHTEFFISPHTAAKLKQQ